MTAEIRLSLYQTALTKLKAFASNKLNVAEMMIFVFDNEKNILGKWGNAGFSHYVFKSVLF